MITCKNIELYNDAMKRLLDCWSQHKRCQHKSILFLSLIVDGFDKHFPITPNYIKTLTTDITVTIRTTTTTSSTSLKLYAIELLKLVNLKTISVDILQQLGQIVDVLLNDTNPIVKQKCYIAIHGSKVFTNKPYSDVSSFLLHSDCVTPNTSAKVNHICDTNWCRIVVPPKNDQNIWSIINRVKNDLQFLYAQQAINALSLEQIQAIKDLPLKSLKENLT